MAAFSREVFEAAAGEREVRLTTRGRTTGKAHRVTIWIATDGTHLYIRSGAGMKRDWPQNLVAAGEAELAINGLKVRVKPRQVGDPAQARGVSGLYRTKYGGQVKPSEPDQPLTAGETATFELLPAE